MSDIRVVLVEDHDLTRVGLRTALNAKEGITIVGEAANATSGLEVLKTMQPDVAIVDIGLPDVDGIELVRRFKGSVGTADQTRIIILTMHDTEDAVLAAFGAGADSYCMKDIGIDELATVIQETHAGNSWIDPAIASVVLQQVRQPAMAGSDAHVKTVAIDSVDPEYEAILENAPLTERELEILELIVHGCSNAEIAERLYITVGTVKTHVRNVLNKLCANDRTQAAVRALRSGLVV
jgi:DNA-binding NarL/FixJ family response regulator